jgi:peroxiredoxin Q/BCP
MLEDGDDAPTITAPNQHGESVSPAFESPTVVYFYPEDDTPGCTTQAAQFAREAETYEDAGVTVYGVSTDGVDSHRAFAESVGLEFDLLADPDGEVADAFGLDLTGAREAAPRTTFVLADGVVARRYTDVDPDGHARDVLADALEDGVVTLS